MAHACTLVCLYDIAVVGTRKSTQWFSDGLLKRFKAKNLGEMKILGLEIVRDRVSGTILVHQTGYINSMLARFNLAGIGFGCIVQ